MTRAEFNRRVDAFFAKYNGQTKGYPTDNDYRGECLSIVKLYMKEVFGFNPPPSGVNSAYGYWTNFPAPLSDYFEKIPNTATGVPQKGDIPIWKSALAGSNGFGHIVVDAGGSTTNIIKSFGQNWGGKHAHFVDLNYTNIYGWLRPRNINDPEPVVVPPTHQADPKDAIISDLRSQLAAAQSNADSMGQTNIAMGNKLTEIEGSVKKLTDDLIFCQTEKTNLEEDLEAAKNEINSLKSVPAKVETVYVDRLVKMTFIDIIIELWNKINLIGGLMKKGSKKGGKKC